MDREQRNDALHRQVNRWAARIVPLILVGIVGYTTWVVVVTVGVQHLLDPPKNGTHPAKRTGAGTAIIVLFFVLGAPMAVCYFRVLYQVATDPGLVPRSSLGAPTHRKRSRQRSRKILDSSDSGKSKDPPVSGHGSEGRAPPVTGSAAAYDANGRTYLDRAAILEGREAPPPGLEQFYQREVFECDVDGLPRWCSTCRAWKPDRTHHSTEVGRCVYKMDHFCPWAGGMIAERNFKFFIQFLWYTVIFCAFVIIVLAYFMAEAHREGADYNVKWIVNLALAVLFFLFSFGIGANSLFFAFVNTTTVDRLAHSSRACNFAVLMPRNDSLATDTTNGTTQALTSHPQQPRPIDILGGAMYPFSTINYPLSSAGLPLTPPPRSFAILQAPTGTNPYNLPSKLDNFRTVFGYRIWDWFLPLRQSPCCAHGGSSGDTHGRHERDVEKGAELGVGQQRGMYKVGPVLEKLKRDAGLSRVDALEGNGHGHSHSHSHDSRKRRRRKRHFEGRNSRTGSSSREGLSRRDDHRHGHGHGHGHRRSSTSGV